MLQLIEVLISSCMHTLMTVVKGYAAVSESNVDPEKNANGKSPADEMGQKQDRNRP